MSARLNFQITAGTDVGLVRGNNEDNFILNPDLSLPHWFLPQDTSKVLKLGDFGCVVVVADGMGGANCGEVASAIAVEHVRESFNSADLSTIMQSDYSIIDFLRHLVSDADLAIKTHASLHPESRGMGTTLVIGWLLGQSMHIVWCGDSRAYVYNHARGLKRLTKDHSRVQSYIDRGILTEESAFGHPESNIITRCLGDNPQQAQADYLLCSVQPSDLFLFCTDGLSAYCPDSEIEQVLQQTQTKINLCRNSLVAHALQAGGYDNITVAVLAIV